MSDNEGGNWITVNGTHIFVRNSETPEQAIERSFDSHSDKLATMLSYHSETSRGKNGKANRIVISKQEYAVLRKEVMRKNSMQKGKVKSLNFAYTANYFYVYNTNGEDNFVVIKQLDIEENSETINFYENLIGGKKLEK